MVVDWRALGRLAPWLAADDPAGCWVWTGALSAGYGSPGARGDGHHSHSAMWRAFHGLVPRGLELDHLCRNRACCNPDHLEPVTHGENMKRGQAARNEPRTHCQRGHEMTDGNSIVRPGSRARCRTCANQYSADRKRAIRASNREAQQ